MSWLSCICGQSDSAAENYKIGNTEEQSDLTCRYEDLMVVDNVTFYSYKELKVATDDFRPANKIGEGGFGSVYVGKLRGQMTAIKVLSSESRQGVKEFLTEIKVISDVHHENLVDLSGCCVEDNHRILVYNYLENGSLDRTLLGRGGPGGRSSIQFNWPTRVKICIGIAKGLAYLHEEVRPHVIHRDIKASNILLGKDLTPKISDFGLAKLIPANKTHVSTRVAGTIGYLAPEYAIRGQVTRKSDIYSFGVLLIEIVTGRSNTNSRLPKNERFLLERTWQLHKKNQLLELVDTSLNGDFDDEQACKFLMIGLLCTQNAPKLRPSMSTVVLMLDGEQDVDNNSITEPGMLSDFMDMRINSLPKDKADNNNVKSSDLYTTGSDTMMDTTVDSAPSSQATMTFASIYDRSR